MKQINHRDVMEDWALARKISNDSLLPPLSEPVFEMKDAGYGAVACRRRDTSAAGGSDQAETVHNDPLFPEL